MSDARTQPSLSLCMIVRDAAPTLPACLASIRPWIDELIVVDTGSCDNTREIAGQFDARLFEFPWCDDFSAARNESLRHASGQWIFWMDADDTIDDTNGRGLRALAHGGHARQVLGYVARVVCPGRGEAGGDDSTVVDHVKLIRNLPDLRFEFRIHEQLLPSIRRLGGEVAWTDLFVTHSGSDQSPEGRARKYERDLRILRLELIDRPDHPFALFNVGMTYSGRARAGGRVPGTLPESLFAPGNPGAQGLRAAHPMLRTTGSRGRGPRDLRTGIGRVRG